jgi:[acyl-carrier-protein] S-malonyltransferase
MNNKKVAFVFPGQGCQKVGMGKNLIDKYEEAGRVFEEADEALGFPLSKACFYGPDKELTLTRNAQPGIVTTSIAFFSVIKSLGITPDIVSGHSVGEYSALVASGVLSLGEAVRLVSIRGRLMEKAYPPGAGGMSAILGLGKNEVVASCKEAQSAGWVESANYNSPNQVVISGDIAGLKKAEELCRIKGARRVIRLKVSGPFHSKLMDPAGLALEYELKTIGFNKPYIPQVMNADAEIPQSQEVIKETLARQISRPILWEKCVRKMWEYGACIFVQVGPGKVLTNLINEIEPRAKTFALDSNNSIDDLLSFVRGALQNGV